MTERGRLKEIVFKTSYIHEKREYVLYEHYGKGYITYELYKVSAQGLNNRKLEALIKATSKDMERAETAILRMAEDKYRQVIFDAQVYANTGAGTYEKAVDMATRDFLAAGIHCVEYKNGARHALSDYADMALRTAGKRAYLQGEGEKRKQWGIYTVKMNKRGNPCPKCLPFCGKVFIDDVWSGGPKSGVSPVTGLTYPLMSDAVAAGLYHPRCRDHHSTYYEGISTPPSDSPYTQEQLQELADKHRSRNNSNMPKDKPPNTQGLQRTHWMRRSRKFTPKRKKRSRKLQLEM